MVFTESSKVLENAEKEAVRFHADAIGTEHILIAMIKETDCVASRLLTTLSVNMQKVFVDTLIAMGEDANLYREEFQNGRPGKKKNNEGTPTLDQYSRDLTQLATEGALDPVVGREEEIQRVIQILSEERRTIHVCQENRELVKRLSWKGSQSVSYPALYRTLFREKEWYL